MKSLRRSLAIAALGAVTLFGIAIAVAGTDAPATPGKPCPGCPQPCADNAAGPPMMDRMKEHLDGMKSALAALRESEKALAATEDPKAFRAAVIDHLRKLDDLQASHLTHMESMMARMHGGMPGMERGRCPDCKCKDCRCKDCRHGDDCCCCKGEKPPAGGHGH